MNLRRKLFTTFGVLALLGLVVAGVSIWATVRWEQTNDELRDHYTRSLQAQHIRSNTFEAFKEIPDALGENDPDARQEFEAALEPVEGNFEVWRSLADTEEERRQIREVRNTYNALIEDSQRFFDLMDSGRRDRAEELAAGDIEEEDFENFEAATGEAVASDRALRDDVRTQTENTRHTAQIVLIVSSFGTVSLLLLVAGYLASDLFRPLRELGRAFRDAGRGDLDRRLDEERADEVGEVNREFNRMVEEFARRERMMEAPVSTNGSADGSTDGSAWRDAPSRATLHQTVAGIRSGIERLGDTPGGRDGEERRALVGELDQLSRALARITEFGFPLDLDLDRTDVRALLYDLMLRFQGEFAERSVSVELEIGPEVDYVTADQLKLREVLSELVRNALAALPERGGRLGLRSQLDSEGRELLIEVADDGAGAEQSLIDEVFDSPESAQDDLPHVGLNMARAVVERHGVHLGVDSEPGEGTYAQIRLLLRR